MLVWSIVEAMPIFSSDAFREPLFSASGKVLVLSKLKSSVPLSPPAQRQSARQ